MEMTPCKEKLSDLLCGEDSSEILLSTDSMEYASSEVETSAEVDGSAVSMMIVNESKFVPGLDYVDEAEKIATIAKAANVTVESYWPSLFAKLVEKRRIEDLIVKVGSGGGGAPVTVAASAPAAAAAPAAEEKKEEPKEESDDDMGFSLFD